jgi:uncharacterized protein
VAPDADWGARLAVGFASVLRAGGVEVPVGSVVVFTEALGAVRLDDPDEVYWAGRATLVTGPADVPAYDAAFERFWRERGEPVSLSPPSPPVVVAVDDDEPGADSGDDAAAPAGTTLAVRYSPAEVLRTRDFASYTAEELAEVQHLFARLRLAGSTRRSRRHRPSSRRRGRPDLRRTVRHALRAGGEPVRQARRERAERPRRIVLLVDVSGSMEPYARALLRFAHVAVAGRGRVEAFTLGTRLTRLTRELTNHDPDAALAAAAGAVADWSGGTRLGEGLRAFNDEWGVRGMARGAVVVVLSDGWDRGEPEVLAEQMARLRRVAHRVVWVNPLKATPGYAPLARGMAAALPHVDHFVEGHSLESLEQLTEVIGA